MAITWTGHTTEKLEWLSSAQTFNNTEDDNNGFTKVIKSFDANRWFVANSGDDIEGDGSRANPFQTIGKADSLCRAGYPDIILLRCGDDFSSETAVLEDMVSGRSLTEPRVVTTYDDHLGARPLVPNTHFANTEEVRHFISFIGLNHANGGSGGKMTIIADNNGLTWEDCEFIEVEVAVQFGANLTMRRNIFEKAYHLGTTTDSTQGKPSNIFVNEVDGVNITENVFDYGGWSPDDATAGANQYNHNAYLQYTNNGFRQFFTNNICSRASSTSVQLRAGGVSSYNFSGQCAVGVTFGYGLENTPMADGVPAWDLNSVASECYSMMKGADNGGSDVACAVGGLCTGAVWGSWFTLHGNADYQQHSCVVSQRAAADVLAFPTGTTRIFQAYEVKPEHDIPEEALIRSGNAAYHVTSPTEGDGESYSDPTRNAGTYYQYLLTQSVDPIAGDDDYDSFMNLAKSRLRGTWDSRITARALNEHIQVGHDVTPYTGTP